MKMLVESLERMYKKGTLTKEQISERVAKGSISADEYEDITKSNGEIQHNDEPEQDDEEVQG